MIKTKTTTATTKTKKSPWKCSTMTTTPPRTPPSTRPTAKASSLKRTPRSSSPSWSKTTERRCVEPPTKPYQKEEGKERETETLALAAQTAKALVVQKTASKRWWIRWKGS